MSQEEQNEILHLPTLSTLINLQSCCGQVWRKTCGHICIIVCKCILLLSGCIFTPQASFSWDQYSPDRPQKNCSYLCRATVFFKGQQKDLSPSFDYIPSKGHFSGVLWLMKRSNSYWMSKDWINSFTSFNNQANKKQSRCCVLLYYWENCGPKRLNNLSMSNSY